MVEGNDNPATSKNRNFKNTAKSHQQVAKATKRLIKTIISPQNQLIIVHLKEDNYLVWKLQAGTTIQEYDLKGFILDTMSIPFIAIYSDEWDQRKVEKTIEGLESQPSINQIMNQQRNLVISTNHLHILLVKSIC